MAATRSRHQEDLLVKLVNAIADQPRASMGQLAAMAGVSRATLSRHFPSRDDMMLAMAETGISSAEAALSRARPHEGPPEQALRRLIEELLPIAELYAFIDQQMHSDAAVEARVQPLQASLITLFQHWQETGVLRVDLTAPWMVESMSALLCSAATMIRTGRLARQDAAQSVFELLWKGASRQAITDIAPGA